VPVTVATCGSGSSVGIATGYGLDGPGIESIYIDYGKEVNIVNTLGVHYICVSHFLRCI